MESKTAAGRACMKIIKVRPAPKVIRIKKSAQAMMVARGSLEEFTGRFKHGLRAESKSDGCQEARS